jgi:hypothetical protein
MQMVPAAPGWLVVYVDAGATTAGFHTMSDREIEGDRWPVSFDEYPVAFWIVRADYPASPSQTTEDGGAYRAIGVVAQGPEVREAPDIWGAEREYRLVGFRGPEPVGSQMRYLESHARWRTREWLRERDETGARKEASVGPPDEGPSKTNGAL